MLPKIVHHFGNSPTVKETQLKIVCSVTVPRNHHAIMMTQVFDNQ